MSLFFQKRGPLQRYPKFFHRFAQIVERNCRLRSELLFRVNLLGRNCTQLRNNLEHLDLKHSTSELIYPFITSLQSDCIPQLFYQFRVELWLVLFDGL